MNLPFSTEQFLGVFQDYNLRIFPFQFVFYFIAAVVIWLSLRKSRRSDRIIAFCLFLFFIWMGVVYHILHFAEINKAAYIFGAAFIIQSLLFLFYGLVKQELSFKLRPNVYGITGIVLVIYALIIYPLIGHLSGHIYPYSPTFGVPCPTLIFTLGVILWSDQKFPKVLLIIPCLWAIVGFSAVFMMGMLEDLGLLVAALVTTIMILVRDRKRVPATG
jgi:hypothetical protein